MRDLKGICRKCGGEFYQVPVGDVCASCYESFTKPRLDKEAHARKVAELVRAARDAADALDETNRQPELDNLRAALRALEGE